MLREIHELLGVATAGVLAFTAVLGLILFLFPKLRGWLPLQRSTWVQGHRWGAASLLFLATAHILTTDRYALAALAGAAALGTTGLVGLWLKRNRQHFRQAVRAKLALAVVAALLLLVGHARMEREEDEERHGHARGGVQTAPLGATSRS